MQVNCQRATAGLPAATGALAAERDRRRREQLDPSWIDNADDEVDFLVQRQLDAGGWEEIATVTADVTTCTDTGLAAETEQCYRALARSEAGSSPASITACATTDPPAPPAAPGDLVALSTGPTSRASSPRAS